MRHAFSSSFFALFPQNLALMSIAEILYKGYIAADLIYLFTKQWGCNISDEVFYSNNSDYIMISS